MSQSSRSQNQSRKVVGKRLWFPKVSDYFGVVVLGKGRGVGEGGGGEGGESGRMKREEEEDWEGGEGGGGGKIGSKGSLFLG